ncbi:MAG: hypothetical protein JSU01_07950 [Bacteroidetes bacterium]|nr:hypothetical protein [Bacteroidota bacterium]
MIYGVAFQLLGNEYTISNESGISGGSIHTYAFSQGQLSSSGVPLTVTVNGNQYTEISLKCFKYVPPPPRFVPCPEAGKINVPPQGNEKFYLQRNYEEARQDYDLDITDNETAVNIKLMFY